ncbi:MAG: coproporphyrinogen-III oxidase family protein [Planctomycetota bacterium]
MTDDAQSPERANHCAGIFEQPEPAVGSYFVSTYPPFSCWTEAATEDYRRLLDQPPDARDQPPLGLYVHIPFCIDRCQYCYYLSHDDRPGEIDGYLDALAEEVTHYARLPALSNRSLAFVYFGGGTPSILSAARIRRLADVIQGAFPWADAREISFECAPKSVTEAKLEALRDCGFTRISMGVQQLNDAVLKANGRVHLVSDIERAHEAIQRVGFDVTNLDLMVGLVDETDESFFSSLDRVIEMQPESITTYQLEIPLNTPLYRSIRAGTLDSAPASWDLKRARLGRGWDRLEGAGYTLRSGYTAVRDPVRHRFVYQDEQYHGADLLGVGASAFSHLGGINHQNPASLQTYLEPGSRGALPLWRAYVLSDEERLVREFVLQLKLGGIQRDYFRKKFGVDAVVQFAEPLADLAKRGMLEVTDDAVRLTREGLLRVDRLLGAFYRPEHSGIRYS